MVEFTMKKSDFKVLIMINPDDNHIRFSTVLSIDMPSKNTIKWNSNESEVEEYYVNLDEGIIVPKKVKISTNDVGKLNKQFQNPLILSNNSFSESIDGNLQARDELRVPQIEDEHLGAIDTVCVWLRYKYHIFLKKLDSLYILNIMVKLQS